MAESVHTKVYANQGNPHVLALVPGSAQSVLDLGCGAGDNARILRENGLLVDGVCLSEQEERVARTWCREVEIWNLEEGLPDTLKRPYDVFLCSHLLEHICWPDRLLKDIHTLASENDGVIVVALPNLMHLKNRLRLLRGRFDYTTTGLMDETHFRWYTFRTGAQLLERNGFTVEKCEVEGRVPFSILRYVIPRRLQAAINRFAGRCLPGLLGHQLLYVARASEGGELNHQAAKSPGGSEG